MIELKSPVDFRGGFVKKSLQAKNDKIRDIVNEAADKEGIDRALFNAMIYQESKYNPKAVSKTGAVGLGQLTRATAKELKVKNRKDPKENVEASARYLRKMLDKYKGDPILALMAYNWGGGNVNKWLKNGGEIKGETQNYILEITGVKDLNKIYHGEKEK